jgi:predicted transcriptional regulator of viral defense system
MKKELQRQIYEIAEAQQGYFTYKQAVDAGYTDSNHARNVKNGHWIKEQRGIYRLANFPVTSDSEYIIWSLWSTNRAGEVQAVFSHSTALVIHGVSDANPGKLHMTVPKGFERKSKLPSYIELHRQNFLQNEIIQKRGYQVTSPLRTISDIYYSHYDDIILTQAISDFIKDGSLPRYKIEEIQDQKIKKIISEIVYEKK